MFTIDPLPYSPDVLEPFIDKETMILHHDKHHQTYADKLNTALEKYPDLQNKPLETLLKDLSSIPDEVRTAVRNHGGGVHNHNLFWQMLAPKQTPSKTVKQALFQAFGGIDEFKAQFTQVALSHFGSGWAWLVKDANGKMKIYSLPNQDSPLSQGDKPILTLDVWEHAYYLKYQNKRAEYVEAFWNIVNWQLVEDNILA